MMERTNVLMRKLIIVVVLLGLVCLINFLVLTQERVLPPNRKKSKQFTLFVQDSQQIIVTRNVTKERANEKFLQKILKFKNTDVEKMYLYEQLLSSPWKSDPDAIRMFRDELVVDKRRRPDMIIATQSNTAVGKKVKFYMIANCPKGKNPKDYTMEKSVHQSLPKESPFEKKQFKKCSLVGNGGIILNSGCGSQIDDADFVFRFNAAPLHPHRKDAGSKSNLTTFNPSIFFIRYAGLVNDSTMGAFLGAMKEYSGLLWFPSLGSCKYKDFCLDVYRRYNNTENVFVNGHPDNIVAFRDYWGMKQLPSTGFYFVNVAITLCDELHLYGFWPFKSILRGTKARNVRYHYFDDMRLTLSAHPFTYEFTRLLQLHQLGVLKLHVHPCH